jgi:hypothetical protein
MKMAEWRALLRPGDWLTLALAIALTLVSAASLWRGGGDRAVVRLDGKVVADLPLYAARRVVVDGAIGATTIEVQPGRARVASDPGPRQYCVRQGWLTRVNAVAICAPSHVSLTLVGREISHDSLSY